MGNSFGRAGVATVGRSLSVSADGRPELKHGGVVIDWDTVAAAASPVTLNDSVPVAAGEKYLRYGQVVTKITASGKYGPWNPDAVDGRADLTAGRTFIVNRTVKENDASSNHPEAVSGGMVYLARLIVTTDEMATPATLENGPPIYDLRAAMPRLQVVADE